MSKKQTLVRGVVQSAHKEETNEGWIRVSSDIRGRIGSRSYVRIWTPDEPDQVVYCQVRGTPGRTGTIVINEWYREALGWNDLPLTPAPQVELLVEPAGPWGRLKALLAHPNEVVRVGLGLALSGMGLGLTGLGLSMVAFFASRALQGAEQWAVTTGLAFAAVIGVPGLVFPGLGLGPVFGDTAQTDE